MAPIQTWSPATASRQAPPSLPMPMWTWSPSRGWPRTGKRIAKGGVRDAEAVVHLELRGRAALVVFDAADMKGALSTIDATGYYNAGQDCTAATRVLAGKSVSTKSSRAWPPRRKAYR